jgi:hypothetical protein
VPPTFTDPSVLDLTRRSVAYSQQREHIMLMLRPRNRNATIHRAERSGSWPITTLLLLHVPILTASLVVQQQSEGTFKASTRPTTFFVNNMRLNPHPNERSYNWQEIFLCLCVLVRSSLLQSSLNFETNYITMFSGNRTNVFLQIRCKSWSSRNALLMSASLTNSSTRTIFVLL